MDVKKLVLAIMTVDREPQYVHRTLASLFTADPLVHDVSSIHLVIDTDDADYLQDYRHHEKLSFHPLRKAEHNRIGDWSRHRRFDSFRPSQFATPVGGGHGEPKREHAGVCGVLEPTPHEGNL